MSEAVTFDEAIGNAVRLLRMAEGETDRALMERFEKLADSWVNIASLVKDREIV